MYLLTHIFASGLTTNSPDSILINTANSKSDQKEIAQIQDNLVENTTKIVQSLTTQAKDSLETPHVNKNQASKSSVDKIDSIDEEDDVNAIKDQESNEDMLNTVSKDKSTKQKADSLLTQPIKTTNAASISRENPTIVESPTLTTGPEVNSTISSIQTTQNVPPNSSSEVLLPSNSTTMYYKEQLPIISDIVAATEKSENGK